jgi:hypothetical protein
MKKYILGLLVLCAGFPLFAQSNPEHLIFMQPISGSSNLNEKSPIIQMLTNEILSHNCSLLDSPHGADFLLYGSITPYYEGYMYNNQSNITTYSYNTPLEYSPDQIYLFQLFLRNAKTNETVIQQNLYYSTLEEVYRFFPLLIYNLFSQILDNPSGGGKSVYNNNEWLNNWLFFGFGAFWAPRIYYNDTHRSALISNFGVSASVELPFYKFLSFEAGFEFVPEWIAHAANNDRDLMMEIPFSLKFNIRLADSHILSPYGGVHINIPLYQTTVPSLFSWMVGVMYGTKAGSGIFFVNPRFSMDISPSSLNQERNPVLLEYRRLLIHIGAGYKFGVMPKK